MAPKPKGKTAQELRAGVVRKQTLWALAQEGNAAALIELGKLHLGQSGDGSPDADDIALELGRKLRADDV